jgi:hypothetical protein
MATIIGVLAAKSVEVPMTKHWLSSLLTLLVFAHLAGHAHAQVEQGAITGRVFDEGGGVVPGAGVTVTETGTGIVRETVTNEAGQYTVPYLHVGTYEVSASLSGFSGARVTAVVIRVGLTATVDLTLKPGPVQAEVTVTANAVQLELQSPALGNVITGRQMIELPIVGRNPYSLVTLSPGVVDRGNTGVGPLINGARSNSTSVLLDGAEQRNSTTNDLNYSPPLESVLEFKVVTNGLSAEFGRNRRRRYHGGDTRRQQRVPWQPLRLHPQRQVQRKQLDQQTQQRRTRQGGHQAVRLHAGRPDHEGPHLLLRQRRAVEEPDSGQSDSDRSHAAATGGRFLADPHQLGPARDDL